jgi:ribulose-5-phosphate 4-epimerase/fuculose-1-phosphate aldolase
MHLFCRLTAAMVAVTILGGSGAPFANAQPAPSADPALAAAIEDLVAASHILADQGVVDAYGHVSIRHPSNPNHYLMSRSLAPAQVTAADIMEFELDSNPIDQQGRNLFIERFIHGEVYKARPDVNAVVHSHSPAVIPFGITSVPLRPVAHTAAFLWPGVPVWEIRDTAIVNDMLVRNGVLGKALATTLGNKPVALMRGHGDVVVGKNVQTAVARAIYTEVDARILTAALGLGGPITYISAEEGGVIDQRPGDETRAWNMWKDRVMKK